jgi:hypothetical protein
MSVYLSTEIATGSGLLHRRDGPRASKRIAGYLGREAIAVPQRDLRGVGVWMWAALRSRAPGKDLLPFFVGAAAANCGGALFGRARGTFKWTISHLRSLWLDRARLALRLGGGYLSRYPVVLSFCLLPSRAARAAFFACDQAALSTGAGVGFAASRSAARCSIQRSISDSE